MLAGGVGELVRDRAYEDVDRERGSAEGEPALSAFSSWWNSYMYLGRYDIRDKTYFS